jgi:Putative helicase
MKRWWFKHEKGNGAEPALAAAPVGFILPLPAESLLCTSQRKKLLERIWQYTALSEPQFNQLYLDPIRRYASYVQQLPASESHHHAYPGGMLDHGLELVACSLKLRQSYLLPAAPRRKTRPSKPTPGARRLPTAPCSTTLVKLLSTCRWSIRMVSCGTPGTVL